MALLARIALIVMLSAGLALAGPGQPNHAVKEDASAVMPSSSTVPNSTGGEVSVRIAPAPEPEPGTEQQRAGFFPFRPGYGFDGYRAEPGQFPEPPPVRFDWREIGKVTPVGNQGNCGACYALASIANLESSVLIAGGDVYDFSENNVKECDWWAINSSVGSCSGGNYSMVVSFLSQKGCVLEECDPYVPSNVVCKDDCPYVLTLLGWSAISADVIPDPEVLKAYILNSGPLFTAMIAANGSGWPSEFSNYDGSYTLYYDGPGNVDHAVLIVGWDDTLSHAGGRGAWIVKNSYGNSWGGPCGYGAEGGYFTIAYGSAMIGKYTSTVYDWREYDPDGIVLLHDEAGHMGSAVGFGGNVAWGMCKFVPTETMVVERVELWTTDATTDVDIYIYDDFSGGTVSNLLRSDLDNSFNELGYHSVELRESLMVPSGNDVFAVVRLANASYIYPVALDPYGPTSPGHCFVRPDGSGWTDITAAPGCETCDLCIRLRGTNDLSDVPGSDIPRIPGLDLNCQGGAGSEICVQYSIPTGGWVDLAVHDVRGRRIASLVDGYREASEHSVIWDGRNDEGSLSSPGVYFVRLAFDGDARTGRVILLR